MKIRVFGTDQAGNQHEFTTEITDDLTEMAIACNPDPEDDPDWHEPTEQKICSYLAMEYTTKQLVSDPKWYFTEFNYELIG